MNNLVRPYGPADLDAFRAIHAESKLDYQFPELESPLFIVKTVVERAGKPTMLLAARIEAEAYLMTSGRAAERLEDIEAAQAQFLSDLWAQGLDSVYCVVPKAVDRHFGKHMEHLGWERGRKDWLPWTRTLAVDRGPTTQGTPH